MIGVSLAVIGASVLITLASLTGDVWKIVAASVYGATLVFLYLASTLYHSFQGPIKKILQKLDHIAIYFLIAGTYTPFTLVTLRGPWGWWIFGINWALALLGITFEFTLARKTRTPSLVIYVVMGWLIVAALNPLTSALAPAGMFLLALGGVLYTGGIVFFLFDEKVRHFHGVWHLFVMGGSISHYFCILLYLV